MHNLKMATCSNDRNGTDHLQRFGLVPCQSKRRSIKIVQNQLKTCQDVRQIEDMNYSVDQRGVIRNKGDLDSC